MAQQQQTSTELDEEPCMLAALPLVIQQLVISLMKPRQRAALRSSCHEYRSMVNTLVNSIHVKATAANHVQICQSLATEPPLTRFPNMHSLHLTTSSESSSVMLPDDAAGLLLQLCSPSVGSCSSFSYSRHTCNHPPDPSLLSAISSLLGHCSKLTQLSLELLTEDMPLIHRNLLNLHSLLSPVLPLPLRSLSLHIMATHAAEFLPITHLTTLTRLCLSKVPTSMSDAEAVASLVTPLTNLSHLSIGVLRHFDAGYITMDLQPIALSLHSLRSLQINGDGCFLTPATAAPLASLPFLSSLSLQTWRIMTSDSLEHLAHCSNLVSLSFDLCLIEQGIPISPLSSLTQLTSFAIDRPTILAHQHLDLSRLSQLISLRSLSLDWSWSDSEDSQALNHWLAQLTGLTRLQLAGCVSINTILGCVPTSLVELHYHGSSPLDVSTLLASHPDITSLTAGRLWVSADTYHHQYEVKQTDSSLLGVEQNLSAAANPISAASQDTGSTGQGTSCHRRAAALWHLQSLTCHQAGPGLLDILWLTRFTPRLKRLVVLGGCTLREQELHQVLKDCPALEVLDLTCSGLGKSGAEELQRFVYSSFWQLQEVNIRPGV